MSKFKKKKSQRARRAFTSEFKAGAVRLVVEEGKSVVFMASHGVAVMAESVAQAFDENYYLERACKLQVLALSCGREMHVVPDEVAAMTCDQWQRDYTRDCAVDHFNEMKAILDKEEPDYRD